MTKLGINLCLNKFSSELAEFLASSGIALNFILCYYCRGGGGVESESYKHVVVCFKNLLLAARNPQSIRTLTTRPGHGGNIVDEMQYSTSLSTCRDPACDGSHQNIRLLRELDVKSR